MTNLSPVALREMGFQVLEKGLGAVGAVKFLQQCSVGSGNYTEERDTLLSGITLDDIAESIQRHEKDNLIGA